MPHTRSPAATLSRRQRRRALCLGYINGVLWAIGNGLTTGTLVTYLALELGASGGDLGYILAMPAFVGALRLVVPALIRRLGGFKPAALATYAPGYLLLACLPIVALPQWVPPLVALRVFVVLVCAHQLLDYTGTVALWSWLAELVPPRLRGRYFARRQRWQLLVLIPTLLAGGLFADSWRDRFHSSMADALWGYTAPIAVGALVLLASLVPLLLMPGVYRAHAGEGRSWSSLLSPFADPRFQRLLLFGCWFSFFNGLTQSAQNIFPRNILELDVLAMSALRVLMQLGQIGLAPWVGRFSDRYGNRPTLILCQTVVATAPLFYLAATPNHPWWIAGAWLAFSAYVGLNVCLPNLMLKLAPGPDKSAYVATYFAVTGLAYAVSTIAGGWVFDTLRGQEFEIGPFTFNRYGYLFYVAWVTRTLAVVVLLAVVEPGAWTWLEILRGRRKAETVTAMPEAI